MVTLVSGKVMWRREREREKMAERNGKEEERKGEKDRGGFSWKIRGTFFVFCLFVCLFLFLAAPCGMWDLSSPTRDRTCAPCSGCVDSLPPGKS